MRVMVAGAGIGGLCLAQGLLRAGVDVRVYEREAAADSRYQGFRVGLGPVGLAALRECLPDRMYGLLEAVLGSISGERRVVDQHLGLVRELPRADGGAAADRQVLRLLLLAGLGDRVEFGRAVVGYTERADGTVEARFADGGSAVGDLLVGADGVGSPVRRQLLPDAEVVTVPGNALLGRTPLTERFAALVPGFGTIVQGPGASMLLGRMEFPRSPRLAAAELAPEVDLPDIDSYLRWAVMLPAPLAAGSGECADSAGSGGAGAPLPGDWASARDGLLALVDGWHPDLVDLVRHSDVLNSSPLTVRYARAVPHWGTRRVTLLGDAIHVMPPSGGQGANTAFRDAALLCRSLAAVHRGEAELRAAVEAYELQMLDYGFTAVRESLEQLPQFTPVA
ncbi:FAD-dependent monooxygenase [Kitasatospora sp. NBC_01250]|uniref:FAD-dependent oxidoreductase n=1 Tax=unclassified Kitasatospora TaxID=2633591 RepID=UPI002E10B975|nr:MULTISPECIES: FAD-dependent monooxygenase [unclassified Kitasatospora]WSJ65264.1 FAD-dependent monooxygenase [Kitasatospora sp. NBC_01302]